MTPSKTWLCVLLVMGALIQGGCLRPKRESVPVRSYLLSPLPVGGTESFDATHNVGLGIAPVEMPAYLSDPRIVLRQGTSEVRYLENHHWAERLDKGLQRVLGANLSVLLETDRVLLSAWQRPTVQAELYLSVQRFDCDDRGQVVLNARWRFADPGGESTLLTGHSQITRQTPGGSHDIDAVVTELNNAVADLSREIAAAVPKALASAKTGGRP